MDNSSAHVSVARLQVVDTSGPEYCNHHSTMRKKNHRRRKNKSDVQRSTVPEQWPLEAMPIQRAVLEYGRRTAALGTQRCISTLQSTAQRIKNLNYLRPELDALVKDIEDDITNLRSTLVTMYEVEED